MGDEFPMESPLNRYLMLARRWLWVIVLGVVVCGGTTYVISKMTKPTYQATAIFVVSIDPSNPTSSIAAVPTYAQLVTNPLVLSPVVAKHRGMTLQQLNTMIIVKPQTNAQTIELDVQSSNPALAEQLANEVGQSYVFYASSRLPGTLQMLPVQGASDPVAPKPSRDAGIAALIGLGLAVALSIIFEWVEDRLSSPENAQELLSLDVLAMIPQYPKRLKSKGKRSAVIMEKYRMLTASLNATQEMKPFKVVMVTSALPSEGKSTVVANLATFLAMTGRMVLLIDANLHHPVLGQRFQLVNSRGLSNVLRQMASSTPSLEVYGQETDIPTLRVLTAGPLLSGSAELLQSSMASHLFNHLQDAPFDYVLVDAPSLLSVADAQILTSLVEAVLLVVDANKTPRRVLQRTKQVLGRTRTRILGVVLNKSPWTDTDVNRQYRNRKIRKRPDLRLLMTPTVAASHPMRLLLPFTSMPANWDKPLDTLSNKDEPDTQRLIASPEPMNGEVSGMPTAILGQQGKPSTDEDGNSESNPPKKQP
jgi:polysaccharide biosynthesis transport protein